MSAKCRRWIAIVITGTLALVLTTNQVLAATTPIPASLYPAHTRISQISPLSNQTMDCDWGFACQSGQPVTSAPVFHLQTQDALHRLSGWAQFGDTGLHTSRMLFAVYASRYSPVSTDGMPWNVHAFGDFRGALLNSGYRDIRLNHMPRLIPTGEIGNVSVQVVRSSAGDVLALACWTGSIEVEGVVVYAHGSARAFRLADHDLTRQVHAAVNGI